MSTIVNYVNVLPLEISSILWWSALTLSRVENMYYLWMCSNVYIVIPKQMLYWAFIILKLLKYAQLNYFKKRNFKYRFGNPKSVLNLRNWWVGYIFGSLTEDLYLDALFGGWRELSNEFDTTIIDTHVEDCL